MPHPFFANCPTGLVVADASTATFLEVNDYFAELLQLSAKELVGQRFASFIHPDDLEVTDDIVRSLAAGVAVHRFHNRYRRADGKYIRLSWTAREKDGHYFAQCDRVGDDGLDDLADIVETLGTGTEGALHEDVRILKEVLEHLPFGVVARRASNGLVLMNARGRELIGLPEGVPFEGEALEELPSRWEFRYTDGQPVPPDQTPMYRATVDNESNAGTYLLRVGDTEHRWTFAAHPISVLGEPTKVAYVLGFFVDGAAGCMLTGAGACQQTRETRSK